MKNDALLLCAKLENHNLLADRARVGSHPANKSVLKLLSIYQPKRWFFMQSFCKNIYFFSKKVAK
jgi:hypothetical protein